MKLVNIWQLKKDLESMFRMPIPKNRIFHIIENIIGLRKVDNHNYSWDDFDTMFMQNEQKYQKVGKYIQSLNEPVDDYDGYFEDESPESNMNNVSNELLKDDDVFYESLTRRIGKILREEIMGTI